MGSKNKEIRTEQIEKYQQLLNKRTEELEKSGLQTDQINKDKHVKHLKAEIKRTKNAIAFIDKREQTKKDAKKTKADKAAKPAAENKSKNKESKKEEPKKKKSKENKKTDK